MQLTRTNAVFSRTALVSRFCAEIQLSGKSSEFMRKVLFFQKTDGARRASQVEARGPHTVGRHGPGGPASGPRGPVVWPPRPASDALLRTIYRPRPKNARGEVEVARNPPERRHIAKLRRGSQKSPFWHSAGTGNWRRSSPSSPPTPLHQPAMFPPSMCE